MKHPKRPGFRRTSCRELKQHGSHAVTMSICVTQTASDARRDEPWRECQLGAQRLSLRCATGLRRGRRASVGWCIPRRRIIDAGIAAVGTSRRCETIVTTIGRKYGGHVVILVLFIASIRHVRGICAIDIAATEPITQARTGI